ncbi:SWIM zinc finger family protein [Vibrio astriarenae]
MSIMETLQALAEPQTISRGKSLAKNGKVQIETHTHDKAVAKVLGTRPYSVVVSQENGFYAACNCPAAEYQSVCKHAVATALMVWGEQGQSHSDAGEYNSETETRSQPELSLHQWLLEKPAEELVDIALSLIESDSETYDFWHQKMLMSRQALPEKELKKRITAALPKRAIWYPEQVERYFDKALVKLTLVWEGMSNLNAEAQWRLLSYAEDRFVSLFEKIDDSYGYRFELEQQLKVWQLEVFPNLDWSAEKKGQWLFHRYTQEHGVLNIPADIEAIPGSGDTLEAFYHCCEQALMEEDNSTARWYLAKPLLEKARVEGHWQQESKWLQRSATSSKDWLEVCRLHLKHNDEFVAEDHWLRAKRMAKTPFEVNACLRTKIDVQIALDEPMLAWESAKAWFAHHATFEAYRVLLDYQATLAPDESIEVWCETQLQVTFEGTRDHWRRLGANESLIEYYLYHQQHNKAMTQAEVAPLPDELLMRLCHRVLDEDTAWAFEHYYQVIAQRIRQTNNRAYHEANTLLDEIEQYSIKPAHRERYLALIAQLQTEFKAKRNMMALLAQR